MSRSILQAIWPGEKHENIAEYRNSHGTAPIIWSHICERHLGHSGYSWMLNQAVQDEMWKSWKNRQIPAHTRAVLMFTFDHAYVAKKDYGRLARDIKAWLKECSISGHGANHWPQIAKDIEEQPDFPALALWCTSVTSDPFDGEWNDEKDEHDPFDWSKAYDMYAELDAGEAR